MISIILIIAQGVDADVRESFISNWQSADLYRIALQKICLITNVLYFPLTHTM